MSKFERVLSDEDVDLILFESNIDGFDIYPQSYDFEVAATIEQAVLAKLAEQEPVAWRINAKHFCGNFTKDKATAQYLLETEPANVTPLYAHPMPSKQGILDSSKTITKENLPPLPEPHCKHGGGIGYFDSYSKEQMIEYAKSAIDHYKAMLAAAPKYTGEK